LRWRARCIGLISTLEESRGKCGERRMSAVKAPGIGGMKQGWEKATIRGLIVGGEKAFVSGKGLGVIKKGTTLEERERSLVAI